MNAQTLFKGKYLTLSIDPNGYERVTDRTGEVVAILPFIEKDGELLFGVRWEPRSAWSDDPKVEFMSSITGGIEAGEDPFLAAKREFLEEADIEAEIEDFLPLGKVHGAKCLDTTYHLFAIDISEIGNIPKNGATDGSHGESLAHNEMVDFHDLLDSGADALLFVLVGKLQLMLNGSVDEADETLDPEEVPEHENLHLINDGLARTVDDIPEGGVPDPLDADRENEEKLPIPDGRYDGTMKGYVAVVELEGIPLYVKMRFGIKCMTPVKVALTFEDGWVTTFEEGAS